MVSHPLWSEAIKGTEKDVRPPTGSRQEGLPGHIIPVPGRGLQRDPVIMLVVVVAILTLTAYILYTATTRADDSRVVIAADEETKSWQEGTTVYFAISLENTDTDWSSQTVRLFANWFSGEPWEWDFTKTDGSPLDPVYDHQGQEVDNGIVVPKGATIDVWFRVHIPNGSAGQSQQVSIIGVDNYGEPESGSNVTKKENGQPLILTINSVSDLAIDLRIAPFPASGDWLGYGGEEILLDYVVENTGGLTAVFNVTGEIPAGWSLQTGFPTGTEIPGQMVTDVSHVVESTMTLVPPEDIRPGSYELRLIATAAPPGSQEPGDAVTTNGTFTIHIPAPDLQVTNLAFSRSTAEIPAGGETEPVTVFATITNTGGNTDAEGHPVTQVDVWFTVDGETIGKVVYIDVLKHGDSATVNVTFVPTATGDLEVKVRVDAWNNRDGENPGDVAITESDEDDNQLSATFPVAQRLEPSEISGWYIWASVCGTVGLMFLLLLLAYRRRKQVRLYASWKHLENEIKITLTVDNQTATELIESRLRLKYVPELLRITRIEPKFPLENDNVTLKIIPPHEELEVTFYLEILQPQRTTVGATLEYVTEDGEQNPVSTWVFESEEL